MARLTDINDRLELPLFSEPQVVLHLLMQPIRDL